MRLHRTLFGTLLTVTVLFSAPLHAEDLDTRAYVAPFLSYVLADDNRLRDDAWGGTLAIGKPFGEHFELELRGAWLQYGDAQAAADGPMCGLLGTGCAPPPGDVKVSGVGAGANLFLVAPGRGLFLHLDAMASDNTLLNAGLGYDLPLQGLIERIPSALAVRMEALYHDDGEFGEMQFNLGLRIPLGALPAAAPEPVPVPAPVQVVPAVAPVRQCAAPGPGETISLDGCPVGARLVLRGVNFDFDQATLTPQSTAILDEVLIALAARPDIEVEIGGHTDSRGTDAYNLRLSDERASSVKAYLVAHGIAAARLHSRGFGESQAFADNESDAGRELNRRVELKVLATQTLPPEGAPAAAPETMPVATPVPVIVEPLPVEAPAESEPPAPAPEAGAAPAPTDAVIEISGYAYVPATLTVASGASVRWVNRDAATHTISFAGESDVRIASGAEYRRRFDTPGSFVYHCGVHPSMNGTVVVQ